MPDRPVHSSKARPPEETDDARAARRAAEAYEAWKQDPSLTRPWDEVEAELVTEGLLDDDG